LNNTGDKPQINAMMNAKYVGRTAVPPLLYRIACDSIPPHALFPNAVGIVISTLLLKTIINIRYEENKDYIIFKNGLVFGG
jgi:hypothetical protein